MPRLTYTVPAGIVEAAHRPGFPLTCVTKPRLGLAGSTNTREVKTAITPVARIASVTLLRFGDATPPYTSEVKLAVKRILADAAFVRALIAYPLPAD